MTGVPSIVFGLFIYITLVLAGVSGGFAGWKGAIALALLMLPMVTRSAGGGPRARARLAARGRAGARRAALAGDLAAWSCRRRMPGIVTGSLLAVARGAGETAPLLFTAFAVNETNLDLACR